MQRNARAGLALIPISFLPFERVRSIMGENGVLQVGQAMQEVAFALQLELSRFVSGP